MKPLSPTSLAIVLAVASGSAMPASAGETSDKAVVTVAGRLVGAAAVARLHAAPEFRAAMDAARADIDRARNGGVTPRTDSTLETSTLAGPR